MTDKITKDKRSFNMSQIHSKNTKPEILVRSVLHRLGLRFRIHRKDLPGKPDIVLPKLKTIIFVHGCFWHRHKNCKEASSPKTNIQYWEKKITNNTKRDKKHKKDLITLGWRVIIIWECEMKGTIENRIKIIKRKLI